MVTRGLPGSDTDSSDEALPSSYKHRGCVLVRVGGGPCSSRESREASTRGLVTGSILVWITKRSARSKAWIKQKANSWRFL